LKTAPAHTKQSRRAALRWSLAAALCLALLSHDRRPADAGEQKKNAEADLRVIVFDFSDNAAAADPAAVSRAFRDEIKKFGQFSVLDIDKINRAVASAPPRTGGAVSAREKALAIGKSVGAHRVITGEMAGKGAAIRLTAEVLDTDRAAVDLSRSIEQGPLTDAGIRSFARDVAEGMLRVIHEKAEREKAQKKEPETSRPPSAGISFGMLRPGEKISPYLDTTFFTRLTYAHPLDCFRNTGVELSIGYARAGSTDAIQGEVDMVLAPFIASMVRRFHLSDRAYIPDPVIYGGGGITYLLLSGESAGARVSKRGFDLTAVCGAGLSFALSASFSIEFQALIYYLYEDIEVTYRYCGIALQHLL